MHMKGKLKITKVLCKSTVICALAVLACGSLVTYAVTGISAQSDYDSGGYGGDDPVYPFNVDKIVTGDVPEDLPKEFDFEVSNIDESWVEDEDGNGEYKTVVTGTDDIKVGTEEDSDNNFIAAGETIKLKENAEAPEGYNLNTTYKVEKKYEALGCVRGYSDDFELPEDSEYGGLDMRYGMWLTVGSNDVVTLTPALGEKNNIPTYLFISDESDRRVKGMWLDSSKPNEVVSGLKAGTYYFDFFSENFCVNGSQAYNGRVNSIYTSGSLTIDRMYGHKGITKYSVLNADGEEVKVVSIGKDTEGQEVVVDGLEEGSYTVVSDETSGIRLWDVKYNSLPEEITPDDYIKLSTNYNTKITVTNDYEKIPEVGNLVIRKFVYGAASNKEDTFDFRLSMYRNAKDLKLKMNKSAVEDDDPSGTKPDEGDTPDSDLILTSEFDNNPEEYGVNFKGGVATFTLKSDEEVTVKNIPVSVRYKLEEYDASAHDYVTTIDGEKGVFTTTLSEAISISTKDVPTMGAYKYVHEYYVRGEDGELILEGKSDIAESDEVEVKDTEHFDSGSVNKVNEYTPVGGQKYTYQFLEAGYGTINDGAYTEDKTMQYVKALKDKSQIIIMKYVRDLPKKGTYSYVHEYYSEDKDGNRTFDGRSSITKSEPVVLDGTTYTSNSVDKVETFNGVTYTHESDVYGIIEPGEYKEQNGKTSVVATKEGNEIIILRYVKKPEVVPEPPKEVFGTYKIVHEYYVEDKDGNKTKEGVSQVTSSSKLKVDGIKYTSEGVTKVTKFKVDGTEYDYSYTGSAYGTTRNGAIEEINSMTGVTPLEDGSEIIILKYLRKAKIEDIVEPPAQGGKVIVHKTVVGDSKDREFSFVITIDDEKFNETVGDIDFSEGSAEFTLKDGESKEFNLPARVGYRVEEEEYDDYNTTVHNGSGIVKPNETVDVAFVNSYYNNDVIGGFEDITDDKPPMDLEVVDDVEDDTTPFTLDRVKDNDVKLVKKANSSSEENGVKEAQPKGTSAQTNDTRNITAWVWIVLISGMCLIYMTAYWLRRKRSQLK